jgi:uncharacterized protein (DUF1499 family)
MVQTLIAFVLASFLSLGSGLFAPSVPGNVTPLPLGALPGVANLLASTPPSNLGVHDGQLSPCPDSPNCVVSQNGDVDHAILPLTYQSDRNTAQEALLKVLSVVPQTQVITQTDGYIRFESRSRLLGFVDDGEFYFPEGEKIIQVRSASRLGKSDLGVNRRRMEQIRLALQDLGV